MQSTTNSSSSWKPINATKSSLRITNPIRDIVDKIQFPDMPNKPLISLSIGDPTVFGNLKGSKLINETLKQNIDSEKFNGYAPSIGYVQSRKAIAERFSNSLSHLTENDIIITSGCSSAIEMSISVLCEPGQNILLPAPGFSLYQTICEYRGIEYKHYHLDPEKDWNVDIDHMRSLIDSKTAAILINNPSNPCGSVFSKEHLLEILEVAETYKIPIIADEIYAHMTFKGVEFFPISSLSKDVPILTCGGIAKYFVVPGWRLGWVAINDRNDVLKEVRIGLHKLSQLILGANSLVQSIIPKALFEVQKDYIVGLMEKLEENAMFLFENLSKIDNLNVIKPNGAMYLMVGFDPNRFKGIKDDIEFSQKLIGEENVFVLPGSIFKFKNYVRLVICPPKDKLKEACERISSFIKRYLKE